MRLAARVKRLSSSTTAIHAPMGTASSTPVPCLATANPIRLG